MAIHVVRGGYATDGVDIRATRWRLRAAATGDGVPDIAVILLLLHVDRLLICGKDSIFVEGVS